MNFMTTVKLVRANTGDSASACTDNCAYRTARFGTNQSATNGTGANKLRFGMVTPVMSMGLFDRCLVRFLPKRGRREGENRGCQKRCGKTSEIRSIHGIAPFSGPYNVRFPTPSDAANFAHRCTK
jgi:hypothetical protein